MCISEQSVNQLPKIDGNRLLKYSRTSGTFSSWILSLNLSKLCFLNRGLEWQSHGGKLIILESAKLRALRSFVPYMPRTLHALVPRVFCVLRALMSYVLSCLTCLLPHEPCVLPDFVPHVLCCLLPCVLHVQLSHYFCSCFPCFTSLSVSYFRLVRFLGKFTAVKIKIICR